MVTLNIAMLLFVAAILAFSVALVRDKLLRNAQNLGMALADSYATEERLMLDSLQKNAELASRYIDNLASTGQAGDVQAWMQEYFDHFSSIIGKGLVDPYVVIDGRIIGATPWVGDETYDFVAQPWYQLALEGAGEAVISDAYTDVITGCRVVTISQELSSPGDVFAMDVYIDSPELHNMRHAMPEGYSYFLCDQSGNIVYAVTKLQADSETMQEYADFLLEGIEDGSLVAYDASFTDLDGVPRGLYYKRMENGWTVCITIPLHALLFGESSAVVNVLAVVFIVLFAVIAILTVRNMMKSRRAKRAGDTALMLGDSFYAIYRVNFRDGTYEAFKMSGDLRGVLPERGPYALLLDRIRSLVRSNTFRVFEHDFSIDSIRRRVRQELADFGGDFERRFPQGYRWVNIRTLYDASLAPDEVILCFRDVDEEKRRELQHNEILQEALDAAVEGTKAKSEFFSRMSHDMRTPLNAILGFCSLAERERGAGGGRVWEYLDKIKYAGSQLLSLINDILEFSRSEAGKEYLEQKPFDVGELARSAAGIFRDQAQAQGKRFTVQIRLEQSRVLGDEKKLTQVLNNLLSNAVKYTERGDEIRFEVEELRYSQHSKYRFQVEDTGIGMSKEFLDKLFEPYSREIAFSTRATMGTGLGMTIVKTLVRQLSGEVSVESELGKGSCFTVTVPFAAAQPEEKRKEPGQQEEEAYDWNGCRILLAEDNEMNREIACELLVGLGAQVTAAVNGAEAVRLFAESAPYEYDVILMDMQMPELDGCSAASAIRALHRADAASILIIAVTANAFAEDVERTRRAGMNDHVPKPLDFDQLSRVMQKWQNRGGQQGGGN